MGSRSSADTASTTESTEVALQGGEGASVLGYMGDDNVMSVSVTETDYGAVAAGAEVAGQAVVSAESVSRAAVTEQRKAQRDALEFGGYALDVARASNRDALDFGVDAMGGAREFGLEALDMAERSSREAMIFARDATRSGDTQTTQTLIKWGAGAAAVAALAYVAKGI